MTNMTYVSALAIAINALEDGEAKDKLVQLQEQLIKRASAKSSKPTKNQKENEVIKTAVLEVLSTMSEPVQVGTLATAMEHRYSVPKLTALLNQLRASQAVTRNEVKGKAYYTLA